MLLAFAEVPQRHEWLTVFPIVSADEPELSYILMAEAIRKGVVTLEDNGGGNPPHLLARNLGPDPVLLLDCETLLGVQENHSTHQSLLLGAGSTTKVPISCMDPGKWSCEELEERFIESQASFPLVEHQVGILAFLGRDLLGLDALGCPDLYANLHRRLVTGYLITALAANGGSRPGSLADSEDLMALAFALEIAERVAAPSVGHGEYSTLKGPITGGELRHNGHLVHLSVFPTGVEA
ncbi:MAG: hypothetical protein PVJ76_11510 [Gemmatimonadota bacterium]|jgi:hypothetical protein